MNVLSRIPQVRLARMAWPMRLKYEKKSELPSRWVSVLVDHDEFMDHMLEKGHPPPTNQIDITNSRDWMAFYLVAGFSLILIWK